MIVRSNLDMITLEKALPPDVIKQITDSRLSLGLVSPEDKGFPNKHVRRILRVLDSSDVELVRMLLKEGQTNLDGAFALHYAVEYCDSKITTELVDIPLADVNLRNPRGYTVLHVAAKRRDPKILVSLLLKGARPSDLTFDGMKAVQISKRITKHGDYFRNSEEGKPSPKDKLCIEILEQAERWDTQLGEASVSLAMADDCHHGKLLYLENRVALARILFPVETRVAMDIAQMDGTSKFTLGSSANPPSEIQCATVNLNETPFKMNDQQLARMRALFKTVELGKRFFPRCSNVVDKIMDDETEKKWISRDLQSVQKTFSEDRELSSTDEMVGSSEDEPCSGDADAGMQEHTSQLADHELKEMLLKKYSGYLGTLRSEFSKEKKKGKLPKDARLALMDWWNRHDRWPYPTEEDKARLATTTGLDPKQINYWFINQRKRQWKPPEDMRFSLVEGTSEGGVSSSGTTLSFGTGTIVP